MNVFLQKMGKDKFALCIEEVYKLSACYFSPSTCSPSVISFHFTLTAIAFQVSLLIPLHFTRRYWNKAGLSTIKEDSKPSRKVLQKYVQLENIRKLKTRSKKNQIASIVENKRTEKFKMEIDFFFLMELSHT